MTFFIHRLVYVICACFILALCGEDVHARKIYSAVCGRVYLSSGDSIIADGDALRLSVPAKNKKLTIIENAYSESNKVNQSLAPEDVDSVIMWSATAPERSHKLIYAKGFGWCWELERSPYISVCAFSPDGYYCAGNGGMWMRGKGEMLVIKDSKIYRFQKPWKMAYKHLRERLAWLTADDPEYSEGTRTASGRTDQVLRSLVKYNPKH
ncbi:MAG: hypothetical protein K2M12_00785 [Muribaculaceae bacterium]|nr:hypothetical protein [Muribaculaceae bacterium]